MDLTDESVLAGMHVLPVFKIDPEVAEQFKTEFESNPIVCQGEYYYSHASDGMFLCRAWMEVADKIPIFQREQLDRTTFKFNNCKEKPR